MKQNRNPFEDLFGLGGLGAIRSPRGDSQKEESGGSQPEKEPERFDSHGNPVRRFRPFRGLGVGIFGVFPVFVG